MPENPAASEPSHPAELAQPAPNPVVVVDVANVAYGQQRRGGTAKLANVRSVLAELAKYDCKVIAIADASLRHKIDDKDAFESEIDDGRILQAPAGTQADDLIWSTALRYRGRRHSIHILTNDRFPIEKSKEEAAAPVPRVSFMLVEGEFLFQPPLESLLGLAKSNPAIPPTEAKASAAASPPTARRSPLGFLHRITRPSDGPSTPTATSPPTPLPTPTTAVPAELLDNLRAYFLSKLPGDGPAPTINFAAVTTHLIGSFGAEYARKFGYHRPKELADSLAAGGYATLSHRNATLYVSPTSKLLGQS